MEDRAIRDRSLGKSKRRRLDSAARSKLFSHQTTRSEENNMATASASYRKPESKLTLEMRKEQFQAARTLHQVCRDLEELIALVEAFVDEYNIVRYRPVRKAA
jgi:hypothetical protein